MAETSTVWDERSFGEPIEPGPSLPDRVAKYILETIVSNDLPPGSLLPSQDTLAERFGVSRTVVREALRSLVAKDIIEVRSGRRPRVSAVAPESVAESVSLLLRGDFAGGFGQAHEVRAILETEVAALAASRAEQADLERLAQACDLMEASKDDREASAQHDVAFHRLLAESTHNQLFTVMLDSISTVLINVRRSTLRIPSGHQKALAAHRAILRAVEEGDPEAARMAMRRHLDDVASLAEEILRHDGKLANDA